MAWCLTGSEVTKFKKAMKEGKIDPAKLAKMTSEQRRKFFMEFTSKDIAMRINGLFESKLLLKNQQRGMITWAKRAAGMTPEVKRDLFTRIERLETVLDPKEEQQFLRDLASTRLGLDITKDEAKNIADLSGKLQALKDGIKEDSTFKTEADRLTYGRAKIGLSNYVNDLKAKAKKKLFREKITDPVGLLSDVAGNAKAMRASMDNSAIFRQGWKALWTHPKTWLGNAKKSFRDIWRTFGKKEVMDELNADLISRPNAISGKYKKMKLALGTIEEEFPASFAERIPAIGRFYKASENAFTAFVYKTRADIADKYIEIAELSGVELDDRELRSIGRLTNSLTSRGSVGVLEPAANVVNNVFWSPRKLKSDIDFLTLHALDKNFSKFARKQAGINLLKVVMGVAAILGIANAFDEDSVDFDPRSANFGKIKIGNTRFDMTAGMSSIITLAARLLTNSSKSSTTNKITTLNSGEYGSQTKVNVIYNFFENKFSPTTAVVKDLLKGQDFDGNKLTAKTIFTNLFVPLPIANIGEIKKDPDSANILLATMADMLGISTNTYSVQSNWENSTSKTLKQFKGKVGEEKFKRANKKFNKNYNEWIKKTINTKEYESLSEDNKKKLITGGKDKIQKKIFKEYDFRYKTPKKTDEEREEESVIKELKKKTSQLFSRTRKASLIKQVHAAEDGGKGLTGEQRERNLAIANRLREESPEWYSENVGEKGEKSIFGETIGEWPLKGIPRNPKIESIHRKKKHEPSIDAIRKAGKEYDIPVGLLIDIAFAESTFNPSAKSKTSSATGLFQFTNDTWTDAKKHFGNKIDRNDPEDNAKAAAWFISRGYLGKWKASKNKWGGFYDKDELKKYYR